MTGHKTPPGVSVRTFKRRENWLKARSQDVTASAAGALFGLHEYITRYQLWADKSGIMPPEDVSGNKAILRGELLEPVAVELMRRLRPEWQIIHNTGAATRYFRDSAARLGATPDTLVICPQRGPGTVQIKSVERSTFHRKWAPEGADPEPPLWISLQATIEAAATGSRWAAVAPLVIGYDIDLPIIDVPLSGDVMPAVRDACAEFWRQVQEGEEPSIDGRRDARTIEALFPVDHGTEIDLSDDREAYAMIEERAARIEDRNVLTSRIEEIDAEMKARMKGAALAYLPGGLRMTWKTQRKIAPDGRVTAFRVLRIPTPKERVLADPGRPDPVAPPAPARKRAGPPPKWDF